MPSDQREHPVEVPDEGAEPASGPVGSRLPQYDGTGSPVGPDDAPVVLDADGAVDEVASHPVVRARLRLLRDVEAVSRAIPDRELQAWVERLDPESAPIEIVVEAVAAAVRLESAARARTVELAAALARRPEMDPAWNVSSGPLPRHRSVAADELAMRLGVSRMSASRLVHQGQVLDMHLPATGAALAAGHLDAAKAGLLVRRLGDLPVQVAEPVEDLVLAGARQRSLAELRLDVERALIEVDPEGAAARAESARATRQVTRPRPEADGMASMWVVLAAADAAAVDGVLEHTARAARALGDPRGLGQLRADGLRDLVVGDVPDPDPAGAPRSLPGARPSPDAGRPPREGAAAQSGGAAARTGPAARCSCGAARGGAQVRVTVAASTLLGLDDKPADLDGHGPVGAATARALAAGGTWQRIVTDPVSGTVLDVGRTRYRPPAALEEHVRARDRHCAAPGCTVPSARADLDHTHEYHHQRGRAPNRPPKTTATVGLTMPDMPDVPDVPDVPAASDTTAVLAGRGTTATPGTTGTTDAHGARGPENRRAWAPREVPGNHTTAGGSGTSPLGTTSADNLGVLCRRHHRLKTDGGFRLRQIDAGLYVWITPGGHRYLTRPGTDQIADITTRTTPVDPDDPPF